jgi:hypothetical protein
MRRVLPSSPDYRAAPDAAARLRCLMIELCDGSLPLPTFTEKTHTPYFKVAVEPLAERYDPNASRGPSRKVGYRVNLRTRCARSEPFGPRLLGSLRNCRVAHLKFQVVERPATRHRIRLGILEDAH